MKRLLKISAVLLIYILGCGKSCVDDSDRTRWLENEIAKEADSLRAGFGISDLAGEALDASEIQAIQKIKDLAGYLAIYSDISLDPVFRQKAGEMIRGLFISESSRLSVGQIMKDKMDCDPLHEFIKMGFGGKINSARITFDSLYVSEPLQKSENGKFTGKISCYQSIIAFTDKDTIKLPPRTVIIDMVSSMQTKIIGKDTLEVRVVSLGDMWLTETISP